jgi:hypothetical protein
MSTGTDLRNALPAKLKNDVLPAIDELVRVLGGNAPGRFDPATVFPPGDSPEGDVPDPLAHAAQITMDMQSAPIDDDITTNMTQLLAGLDGTDVVKAALDKALDWMQEQLETGSAIGGTVQERIDAWNKLNTENAGRYDDSAKLGFIPAIEGVINSLAPGANVDADDYIGPINDAIALLMEAGATAIFTAYAGGAAQMLSRARSG